MKKLFTFILIVFVALAINAQERTVNMLYFDRGLTDVHYSYYSYTGTSSDVLIPTTRDTIDIPFDTKKPVGFNYNVICSFSARAGVDTIVYIKVLGKNSLNEDYTEIQFDSSAVVTVAGIVKTLNSVKTATIASYTSTDASHANVGTAFTIKQDTAGFKYYPADSLKVPTITFTEAQHVITNATQTITYNGKKEYRYILVRLILPYNDSVGTGVNVDEVELKLWL